MFMVYASGTSLTGTALLADSHTMQHGVPGTAGLNNGIYALLSLQAALADDLRHPLLRDSPHEVSLGDLLFVVVALPSGRRHRHVGCVSSRGSIATSDLDARLSSPRQRLNVEDVVDYGPPRQWRQVFPGELDPRWADVERDDLARRICVRDGRGDESYGSAPATNKREGS